MKLTVFNSNNVPDTFGTSLSGYLNVTYNQLINVLGEPTYNHPSGDNKVQVEWVVEFEGNLFTIYDWKTYNREYTENVLDRFHIGSKRINSSNLETYLQTIL